MTQVGKPRRGVRMMRKPMMSLAALAALAAGPAAADHMYVDTETLYGWCSPYEVGTSGVGPLCSGYINAVADILAHGIPIHDNRACVPEQIRLVDLRNLTIEALNSRPKAGHKNAHDWVARAISEAFPCN
jgi:hypothetical protein